MIAFLANRFLALLRQPWAVVAWLLPVFGTSTHAGPTTTSVSLDQNPVVAGGNFTMRATVLAASPTGIVTFLCCGDPVATRTLSGGVAVYTDLAEVAGT